MLCSRLYLITLCNVCGTEHTFLVAIQIFVPHCFQVLPSLKLCPCRPFTWTWQQRTICGSSPPGTPLTGGTRPSKSRTRIPALQIWQVIASLSPHATCVTLASLCVCVVRSTGWLVKWDNHLKHRKHCVSDVPGKSYRKHSELWAQNAEIKLSHPIPSGVSSPCLCYV